MRQPMVQTLADDVTGGSGDAVLVGVIQGAWGVRGEVKVAPQSTAAAAILHARAWQLRRPATGPSPATASDCLAKARRHGSAVIARLDGVADRSAAEALAGSEVWISRAAFPKADDDEYYWVDLIGCQVANRQGCELGEVAGLIDTGVHSVLRVVSTDDPAAERLIPFVAAYVDEVNLEARRVVVDWGLDY